MKTIEEETTERNKDHLIEITETQLLMRNQYTIDNIVHVDQANKLEMSMKGHFVVDLVSKLVKSKKENIVVDLASQLVKSKKENNIVDLAS